MSVIPGAPSKPPISEPPQPIFRVGEVLADAYEVRAVLGQGGMGQVFDAHDKSLARRVAVKANWPGIPISVRNEAQALAAIRHPGVVSVYALSKHRDVEFMVMEHVSGVTLAHHLERLEGTGLPLLERLDMLIAVADGLAAIHRAGISHGDVKTDNVLLSASGRVVLTDLGLVRAAYEPDAGLVAGTPAYMAPEIVSPKFTNEGFNLVDEYAFGVLAFRMVAGKFPYDADSVLDLVYMQAEAEVPKLSDAASVPRRLSELVEHLMAKEPTERPPTMDAVVFALRAARDEVARDKTAKEREKEKEKSAAALSVLIVDDDADIARLVAMYVKHAAPTAEISIANDAQQALESFRMRSPRLLFLDLNMPKMSGFELFTYLRGARLVDASTVVAMSAGGSPEDVQLMLELGAQDFIPKGPELRARVTKVVSTLVRGT